MKKEATQSKKETFNTKTRYIRQDGWRGYEEPTYAVCGANDTGTYSDSPCPSDVCTKELAGAASTFKFNKIPYKHIALPTSNVFCIHRYIIVPPSHIKKARKLFAEYYKKHKDSTRLLYAVDKEPAKPKTPKEQKDELKTVATVALMGEVFGNTQKEKNDWKERMIRAGLENRGLIMPSDWDTLSEDEKTRRLDGVIKMLNQK
jgi:hypothetical protein